MANIAAFAKMQPGEFEDRYMAVAEYAFEVHAILMKAAQLRAVCGGGTHYVAQRVMTRFVDQLHDKLVSRLSAAAIAQWIDDGLPADMRSLGPKERVVARVFSAHVARLTLRP